MFRSSTTIIRELYLHITKFILKTETCSSDIIVYFNVNIKLLAKLINIAFVGE